MEAEGPSCRRDRTPNTVGGPCRVFVFWAQAALDRITLEASSTIGAGDSAYVCCQQSEGGGPPCQVVPGIRLVKC